MQKSTTPNFLPLKARTQSSGWGYLRDYPSVKRADPPDRADDDLDDPDEPEQGHLPTGPTHVAARGAPRQPAQLTSAREFMAAAGRVKFGPGQATDKAVWMSMCYYASLGPGPERVCFASLKTIGGRSLVSERTVRYKLAAFMARDLIRADHRNGGPAPTTWSIHGLSPSVCGGKNCRGGRQRLPGGAATVAAEVSNRSSTAPTERLLLASKQQPDGAPAPPAETEKPAATNEQTKTETPEPTHTDGQTGGGLLGGGATDKQIKLLRVLADRVGAEHDEAAWRAADSKSLQAQIHAGLPFKDLKVKHVHTAVDEHFVKAGIECAKSFKACGQRCACGSQRFVRLWRSGPIGGEKALPWTFSGYLLKGVTWTAPMSFSEVEDRAHGR